mmetsp:Transcript_26943/g.107827  ORF Transcript_26943/g.107827 Transcript_26943/m.107827 type:complete len:386 (+) Transcript_26943:333-1490(+)
MVQVSLAVRAVEGLSGLLASLGRHVRAWVVLARGRLGPLVRRALASVMEDWTPDGGGAWLARFAGAAAAPGAAGCPAASSLCGGAAHSAVSTSASTSRSSLESGTTTTTRHASPSTAAPPAPTTSPAVVSSRGSSSGSGAASHAQTAGTKHVMSRPELNFFGSTDDVSGAASSDAWSSASCAGARSPSEYASEGGTVFVPAARDAASLDARPGAAHADHLSHHARRGPPQRKKVRTIDDIEDLGPRAPRRGAASPAPKNPVSSDSVVMSDACDSASSLSAFGTGGGVVPGPRAASTAAGSSQVSPVAGDHPHCGGPPGSTEGGARVAPRGAIVGPAVVPRPQDCPGFFPGCGSDVPCEECTTRNRERVIDAIDFDDGPRTSGPMR